LGAYDAPDNAGLTTVYEVVAKRNQEMKRIATAAGICVLLVSSGVAYAGDAFTWTGASSSSWTLAGNWSGPAADYPGKDNTGDTATINVATSNPVQLSGGLYSVDTITIDADTNSATVELEIQSGGSVTTTGLVTVKGDQTGSATATLTVSGGTLQPNSLTVIGGANNSTTVTVTSGSIVTYTPS
jgi:hypothetical protein